jgi:hypothetical protein
MEGPIPIVEPVKVLKTHLRGKPKVYRSQFSGACVKLPEILLSCVKAPIATRLRSSLTDHQYAVLIEPDDPVS